MSAVMARDVLFFAATSWTMATSLATYGRYSRRMLAQRLSSTVKDAKSNSPNGAWSVGEHQPAPYANKSFKSYLSSDLRKAGGLYSLAISAIIPRPIALVTSQDKDGNINCAPYSYFNLVSHDPPLIIVGNSLNVRSATKKKDTLRNIEETGNVCRTYNDSLILFALICVLIYAKLAGVRSIRRQHYVRLVCRIRQSLFGCISP